MGSALLDMLRQPLPESGDEVILTIAARDASLLPVRMLTSGIAAGAGMEMNRLEDIKAAVAESCDFLIRQASGHDALKLRYVRSPEALAVRIEACGEIVSRPDGYPPDARAGAVMIESLVDAVQIGLCDDRIAHIDLAMKTQNPRFLPKR